LKSLSIVIPVYNGENFIKNCVECIAKQDNGNIELVIVNDGSTDKTADVCILLKNQYSFVKYFEKENGGVSSARNLALNVITGEYVWFVDVDDCITDDAIQEIFKVKADLAVFNFVQLNNVKKTPVNLVEENYLYVLNRYEDFFKDYIFCYKLNNALWNKVFKVSMIRGNALIFNEAVKIGEDYLFALSYYKKVNDIYFSTSHIYQYYINASGAMKSKNKDVFTYQQTIAETVQKEYKDLLSAETMQQFLLMQLICGINQSEERGVDKKQLKSYIKGYMQEIMEGKHFSRRVVNNFLKSEGVGVLSKVKFKLQYFNLYK
jgi:glycosyltransferase involved in cell wall biosynthesis